jgi:hypothetical protein
MASPTVSTPILSQTLELPRIPQKLRAAHPDVAKYFDDFSLALRTRHSDISTAITNVTLIPPIVLDATQSPANAILQAPGTTFFQASASSSAPFILNLPPAIGSMKVITIKKLDANAQNVSLVPNGDDTIEGSNSPLNISVQGDVISLHDTAIGAWVVLN